MNARFLLFSTLSWSLGLSHAGAAPDFHTDIAPLLRDYCAGCHNNEELDAGLSVETYAALKQGGDSGAVFQPDDPDSSSMIRLMRHLEKPVMPPKKEPQPSQAEIDLIAEWIKAGAPGPSGPDASILSLLKLPDDAPAGREIPSIAALAFSPDGTRAAIARSNHIALLQADDLREIRRFTGLPGAATSVQFSPDGRLLLAASGVAGLKGAALAWDIATGEKRHDFTDGHADALYDAEFSPDGQWIATAGYDHRLVIRETSTGRIVRTIEIHNGAVFDLAWSPDSQVLASASADDTVKLWQAATGLRLDTLNQPTGAQNSVLFTPDGRHVIAAGADNRIRLWRLVSKDKAETNPLLEARFAHDQEIVRLALSPDGQTLYSASADKTVKAWSLPDLVLKHIEPGQSDVVAALGAAAGDRALLGRLDGTLEYRAFPASPAFVKQKEEEEEKKKAAPPSDPGGAPPARDALAKAQALPMASTVKGVIGHPGAEGLFRFHAREGETWVLETKAARDKSPLDTKVSVLDAQGQPVPRVLLQAVRDSWFTFRGKDSTTSDDFRVQNWREMELNEYLYANGEVVKLWLYPRGPDSGFKVYPGMGARHTYFGTTAQSHALGAPCYIVRPLPPGSAPQANGLPAYTLFYENDDDPQRRWGADSELLFTAPADGEYIARVADVRGFGGPGYHYEFTLRTARPDFKLTVGGTKPSVSPGSGREFSLAVERLDGFDGEIRAELAHLPPGFTATGPIVIEAGQYSALGALYASPDAKPPTPEQAKAIRLVAQARTAEGRPLRHELPAALGEEIKLGPPAKLLVEVLPDGQSGQPEAKPGEPLTLTITPGQTITARVRAQRLDFKDRIELGRDDAGRGLPHGLYVDNIGLNGLLIVEEETERQFFITAAKWAPPTESLFFIKASADGGQVTAPVRLKVAPQPPAVAGP